MSEKQRHTWTFDLHNGSTAYVESTNDPRHPSFFADHVAADLCNDDILAAEVLRLAERAPMPGDPSRGHVAAVLAQCLEDQCDPAADESWDLWRAYDLQHNRKKDDSTWTFTVTSGHGDNRWNVQRLLRYRQITGVGGRWQEFLAEEVRLAYRKLRARDR